MRTSHASRVSHLVGPPARRIRCLPLRGRCRAPARRRGSKPCRDHGSTPSPPDCRGSPLFGYSLRALPVTRFVRPDSVTGHRSPVPGHWSLGSARVTGLGSGDAILRALSSAYLTIRAPSCTYIPMSDSAASEASLADGVRPPTASIRESAPPSGVAEHDQFLPSGRPMSAPAAPRPTASIRPHLRPVAWRGTGVRSGFSTDDPYVRRFWTAAIGPGAVADLMRLAVAAERGRSLPRPEAIGVLVREDLARWVEGRLFVRTTIPPLSAAQERRLSPGLKREHRASPQPAASS